MDILREAGTGVTAAQPEPAAAPKPGAGMDAVFRPRSIAVIGASRERGTIGAELFHNLISHGFNGPVYPVNPRATVVQSVRAYSSIADIPDPVDLAIIVVPAAHVLSVLEACGEKGACAAVVISAGFKEVGGEGVARERALRECALRYRMRLVGPNCLGLVNTEAGVSMDGQFTPVYPPPGKVAFSSQSGALGLAILEYANQLNIGISHFISVGNKADVSGNDLLEFWETDPGTSVILLYLESFGNPRRFIQIARRVGKRKPIVAVKSGRTAAGIRAASSHTGSLAGTDVAVDALCYQSGVIRTDTIEELFDVAMLLANQPVPRGNRVGIVTNAGGPAIMASDACESHGLVVATLEPATVEALRAFLPPEASTRNPVDMIASATPESFERAARLVMTDPNVDAVLVIYVQPLVTRPVDVAQAIIRATHAATQERAVRGLPPKPVLSCFMGSHGVPEGLRSLQEGNIPSYPFPESAAIALARTVRYGRWLEQPAGRVVRFDDVDAARASEALQAAGERAAAGAPAWLRPEEVHELLAAYRILTPDSALAVTAEEAAEAARRMGFPVAIKLVSDTITHKSDVGGVILDVRSVDEVREAFRGIEGRLAAAGRGREMAGVHVQQLVREGVEAIVGVTQDPSFGPLIMFGLGGVYVEILKDVVFRIHPLTDRDAAEMVRGVRGWKLLEGYRGAAPGDIPALEQTLLRISQLLEEHPEIVEMDLNPLKALPPGQGCIVVDARVAVRRAAG
jgi:acetyl coenzyme A synthetase (ADP forming)-like protein